MTSITGFDTIHYEAGEAVAADANEIWICTPTAAVTKGQLVEVYADALCKPEGANITGHVGIALTSAAVDGKCRVLVGGYGTATAASEIKIGQYVKADAAGKAVAGVLATDTVVGLACNHATANGVVVVKLMMVNKS